VRDENALKRRQCWTDCLIVHAEVRPGVSRSPRCKLLIPFYSYQHLCNFQTRKYMTGFLSDDIILTLGQEEHDMTYLNDTRSNYQEMLVLTGGTKA